MKTLIVESAAKARTIQKYLGPEWRVHATGGHVQGLPESGKQGKKAMWANRPGQLPAPPWEWTDRGEKAVATIIEDAAAHDVTEFYLATDPDREGEFIAWRLADLLSKHGTCHRVTFQEVTREAITAALEQAGPVEMALVDSALVRKFLDRLVGFRTSKFARSFLTGRGAASMGRVQTPALGFVVERELEREAHVPIPYFEVRAVAQRIDFSVRFHEPADADVWRDDSGKPQPTRTADEALAERALAALEAAPLLVIEQARERSVNRKPAPPFSTQTLLQAAGSRWGWSPRKTSALATALYEAGHITYIRTDSTRLAASAVAQIRELVSASWGEDHLGPGAREAASGGKIQDAHEAIRPTRLDVAEAPGVDEDTARLYRLIRGRTLGSQMSPSRYTRIGLTTRVADLERPLTGTVSWRVHAGWEAAFAGLNDPVATEPPPLQLREGAELALDPGDEESPNPLLVRDATRPPARLRAHTLIRLMKESGIGRPSTYAKTVEKLEQRNYLEIDGGALVPTERGRTVWLEVAPFYEDEQRAADLFSVAFTAEMERTLDLLETGEAPAPETWEKLRDDIRQLHEMARERRAEGSATPRRLARLELLLANAPEGAVEVPEALSELSEREAIELGVKLQELGVEPAPSASQRDYIQSLLERCELSEEEGAGLLGLSSLEELKTSRQASALIDQLGERAAKETKPSPKQLGMIRKLAAAAELTEAEACALVEAEEYAALTGGRAGSASQLIDALKETAKKR